MSRERLTIGMAVYEDFDGVYFTIQSMRAHNPDVDWSRVEFMVVDNCPEGKHAPHIKRFMEEQVKGHYVPLSEATGTAAPRNLVFERAPTELAMCVDSHILLMPGALRALFDHFDANPGSLDLIQGPLVYDDLRNLSSHFTAEWGGGMYGRWGTDPRASDPKGPAFEITAQGLGLFACRKAAWLGFNKRFRGFGGEEHYIHDKFRRAGRRCLCLPALRWVHRFSRPNGTIYANKWEDRIRNYFIGWRENGRPIDDIVEHFTSIVGRQVVEKVLAEVEAEEAQMRAQAIEQAMRRHGELLTYAGTRYATPA